MITYQQLAFAAIERIYGTILARRKRIHHLYLLTSVFAYMYHSIVFLQFLGCIDAIHQGI
jgi:hypothetical protein